MKNDQRLKLRIMGLLTLIMSISFNSVSAIHHPPQKLPNVLFIAIEDFNPDHLGCYGGQALTPNIDRLAAEGMLFRNAYVDVAVCNPSRTALLTGLRPPTSRVYGNSND